MSRFRPTGPVGIPSELAGHTKAKAVATAVRPKNQRTRKRTARNRRLYGEVQEAVARQGVKVAPGTSTASALEECLGRAVANMRYAASEVDKLKVDEFWVQKVDAQGNILVEPDKWYQLEGLCRDEVERLAGLMTQLNLGERAVKVEEAKAVLMIKAVREAARDAGLSDGDVRKLGGALRNRLEAMDPVNLEEAA